MKTVAVRNINRTDAGLAARLGDAGASTVHEAQGCFRHLSFREAFGGQQFVAVRAKKIGVVAEELGHLLIVVAQR